MEGIPGHTSHRLSRGGGHGDLGGSLHVRKHARRRVHEGGKSGEATGMSEARSHRRRGNKTPTIVSHAPKKACVPRYASECRSAEAVVERRETLGPPVKPRRAQTLRGVHAAKAAAANRERARCGYTQVIRVAEVDRTHRASCSLGDRKVSWRKRRALAGRKLEAPPDAGHEQREGESVRGGTRFPITGTRAIGLWVSARRLTRRRKAFSGTHVSGLYRQGTQGPSARRSNCVARSARSAPLGAHRAVRRPTRACLRVTTRMSEVDAVRSRLHEVREGPRGVGILDAEKASVEWCA